MAVELGQGYISVTARTDGMSSAISKGLAGAQVQADGAGQGMGAKLAGGLGKTLKIGAAAVGVAAGVALTGAIAKGMGRLTAIENAESKLAGLGHSTTAVAGIMDNALASVSGTAFGLGDAASVAASAVAAGIKPGQDLERTLKLTGDAATIAGVDIGSMGDVFNKVAAANRLSGGEIMQLNKMGIPIVQLLAKEMGTTSDEVLALSKKGKIGFADFQNAMERGLGGSALESGATFQGALANMGAAVGRFGAELMKPAFSKGPATFGFLTKEIDKATAAIKPLASSFSKWLDSDGIPKLQQMGSAAADTFTQFRQSDLVVDSVSRLSILFDRLQATAKEVFPALKQIGSSLAEAAAATGVSSWKILLSVLESTAMIVDAVLVPSLKWLADLMERSQGAVNALAIAFVAFKTLPSMLSRIAAPIGAIGTKASGAVGSLRAIATATGGIAQAGQAGVVGLGRFGSVISAIGLHRPAILRAQDAFMGAAAGADRFGRMAGAGAAGMSLMGSAGNAAVGGVKKMGAALGGVAGVSMLAATLGIMAVSTASTTAKRHAEALDNQSESLTKTQSELAKSLRATGGALDESVTPALAGAVDRLRETQAEFASLDTGIGAKFGAGIKDAWDAGAALIGKGNGSGFNSNMDAFYDTRDVKEAAAAQVQVFKDLGMTSEEIAVQVHGSAGAWDHLAGRLRALGPAGVEVAQSMWEQRNSVDAMKTAIQTSTPGANALTDAMQTLADASSSASEKTSALRQALQSLGILETDPKGALFDLADAVEEVGKKSQEAVDHSAGFGKGLLNEFGDLDATVGNARKMREELSTIGDAYQSALTAGNDAHDAWAMIAPQLDEVSNKYGLYGEAFDKVAASQGNVKPEVVSRVTLEGASEAAVAMNSVAIMLDEAHKRGEDSIQLRIEDAGVKTALADAGFKVNELVGSDHEVKITADSEILTVALNSVIDRANALGEVDAIANLDLNTVSFDFGAEQSEGMIGILDALEASPTADLIIKKLQEGKAISMGELKKLSEEVADPDAMIELSKFLADATVMQTKLDELSRARTVEIRGQWMGAMGVPTGFQNLIASGNPIERATGGPVFGAGTATSDSIPALLSNGEHVLTAAEVDAAGGHGAIYRMRDAIKSGVARFATGGAVGTALAAARSKEGNLYSWGGIGPDRFDCSGFVGFIQQIVMGISEAAAAGKRLYTTNSLLGGSTAGLVRGYNADSPFNVGVSADHMAATVGGVNVESGGASSPSSSGVGPGRAGALDSQFGTQFHLPVSLVEGGYEQGAVYAATGPVWSEKDELDLKSARVAITQAQEAAAKARSNPKKSSADIEQAELKVARAEQKVADLEGKKEGRTGVQALTAPAAPPLMGGMDEDAIGLRQAELAVTDAQLSRDKTYNDPASLSSDKEKADLAVYSAQNRLVETQKQLAESNNALAATGGVKGAAQRFASDAAGIGYDAFWDIIGFQEPRWFKMDAPTVPGKPGETYTVEHAMRDVPPFFSDAEIANQNPSSDMDEWLKKQRPALHDEGGWLEPGLTLNLTKKPEAVFNGPQLATLTRIANLDQQPAGERERTVEVHHHYHLTDVKDIERIKRQDRQRQMLQWGP